jgi:hypothetical protein
MELALILITKSGVTGEEAIVTTGTTAKAG